MRRLFLSLFCLSASLSGEDLPETLEQLMSYAERCNPELQALSHEYRATCEEAYGHRAAFLPELSAEGGIVSEALKIRGDNYGYGFLEARWNLFRGGHDEAESKIHDHWIQQAYLRFEQHRKALRRQVWREFAEILYFQNSEELYAKALETNREQRHTASKKWGSGLTTEADVIEFDLFASDIKAEMQCHLREWDQHRHKLALLLSVPGEACQLHLKGTGVEPQLPEDCTQLFDSALCHREERFLLHTEAAISTQRCEQARALHRPRVDLRASWGTEPDTEDERSLGSKLEVNVSLSLFDGGHAKHLKQSLCEQQMSLALRQQQLEQRISTEISTALCKLQILQQRLETARERQSKIENYWTLTREEYARGVKNSPDLAGASERLLRSQLDVLALERDIQLALMELSASIGSDPTRTFFAIAEDSSR